MAKNPRDPTRHTPPAGQRAKDDEERDRSHPGGQDRSQLEGGREAEVLEQPGRSDKSDRNEDRD